MSTVLGIWAHPDDEAFVAGGFLADAARRGHRVVCIYMTRGEAGLGFRESCPPHTLADIRRSELEASLSELGVEEQRSFDFPDGCLAELPGSDAIGRIHSALVDEQPAVIVTFGPDGFTGHPDHQALSAWVTAAVGRWNNPGTLLYHAVVSRGWKDSFVPALNEFETFWPGHPVACSRADLSLMLDEELVATKVEALRAHESQMKPFFDAYGERFMNAVAATEHFRLVPVPRRSIQASRRGGIERAA
jgi:LmbE family N-acetylglucosaminyl deacetylase